MVAKFNIKTVKVARIKINFGLYLFLSDDKSLLGLGPSVGWSVGRSVCLSVCLQKISGVKKEIVFKTQLIPFFMSSK